MRQAGSGNADAPMTHREPKRWLWFSSLVLIAVSILAYVLFVSSPGNPVYLAVPAIAIFVMLPVADWWVGEDPRNLSNEIEGELAADPYYQLVAYLLIAAHYAFFFVTVWMVANHSIPIWALVILLIGTATINGNAINIGHELGHKVDGTNRFMAKVALALSGYGHFTIEHNRGHHVLVATPEDCASARMGENVYAFASRELPGALIGGWSQERRRLAAKGLPVIHWRNEILHVYAATLLITGLLVFYFGWTVLPFIVLHHFLSWYALTQINYIEHYGLLRQKRADGRYEPCEPHHSWNSNHLVSNLVLLHLQRHSDHHVNPQKPYQILRNFEDLPRLPSGYPGCMVLAAIPPLWFAVMDPLVKEWADGDPNRINMN